MDRAQIGIPQGFTTHYPQDIYVFNRTGAVSVLGDCWSADLGNTSAYASAGDFAAALPDPTNAKHPNANMVLISTAATFYRDVALCGIVQEAGIANGSLTKVRIKGHCAAINIDATAGGASAGGQGRLHNPTTAAGKCTVLDQATTTAAGSRVFGWITSAHLSTTAEAVSGWFDGTLGIK